MRAVTKNVFLIVLLSAALFAQKATASIVELANLPNSSYAALPEVDNWQGKSLYNKGDFQLLIEFAVYDTDLVVIDTDEYLFVDELVDDFGLSGQYIYAYQVFQTSDSGYEDVGSFGILKDEETVNGTDVSAMSDFQPYSYTTEGQAPDESINIPISWKWSSSDPLSTGEHSWFLVFSSDFEPVAGDYRIEAPEAPEDEDYELPPAPGGENGGIPEPATMALLGIGGATILLRRRKPA